jgi:hypothetical protein
MALTFSTFDSFAEVEAYYNNTTPLRGSTNVGKDIRPIGDRNRKWERIVKISPNCYALSDGFHFGDEIFDTFYYGADNFTPTLKDMEKYAPIVWRKKCDGTEEVTLRNGWGPGAHNGRYQFLYRHTPKGMWFRNRNGKHFIQNGSTDHYIAKVRTAPKPIYDAIMDTTATPYWQKRHTAWVRAQDDNSAVTFRKNEHGGWDHVEGTGQDITQMKAPTVKKEVKAKYKDAIKSFFEWGMTMSPLLPLEDREYRIQNKTGLYEHFKPEDHKGYELPKPKFADLRKIVADEDHPMRLSLWVVFAGDCTDGMWGPHREYYTKTAETKEDLQRVRSRYNTFINKQLGFMTN